jgi:hypothetical protein
VVVSVPPGLDAAQRGALEGYVAYDQVTWDIWFTGTGVERADAVATDPALTIVRNNYAKYPAGQTISGTVRAAITSVVITSQLPNLTAEVTSCTDRSGLVKYDADGNDISNPDTFQARYEIVFTMKYVDGVWKGAAQQTKSKNECTV